MKHRAPGAARAEEDTIEPIYILSGVRTAIGTFGGSLKDIPPARLGALVIAEAVKRAGIAASDVGHVVMGSSPPRG